MGRHYRQGAALFELRRFREAADAFTEDLAEEPQAVLSMAMRAASWLNLGQVKIAHDDVRGALRINPSIGYPHYILSCVRAKQGNPRDAETAVREAIRLEQRPLYYFKLAEIFYFRRHYTESLRVAEEGLAIDPTQTNLGILRAKCLIAIGKR